MSTADGSSTSVSVWTVPGGRILVLVWPSAHSVITGICVSLRLAGWISIGRTGITDFGVPFFMAFMIKVLEWTAVGLNEEITFGYQLKNLAEGLAGQRVGARRAITLAFLLSSGVFGLAHLANALVGAASQSGLSTLNLVIGGLWLALPYLLTGELASRSACTLR